MTDFHQETQPPERPTPRAARIVRDKDHANRIIAFVEGLTIPSGKGAGKPLKLYDFQKRFIRSIYEPHRGKIRARGGKRVVRRAILSMARKNGKSSLTAALALVHLVGPEAIVHGEIYSCANDRDQASIVFKLARQMLELEPDLMKFCEVVESTKRILCRQTGSVYRAVSAEVGTKHGYNPSMVIYDELAQSRERRLYDVFDTAFGARDEPLMITISTQSNDPQHILSQLIDDGLAGLDPTIVCQLHAADDGCDLDDQEQWKKANPALDKFRDRNDLEVAIKKAMRMPAEEPKVRNLMLNQRIAPTATLIARAEWMACAGAVSFAEGEEVYVGLDLASIRDLAALVIGGVADPVKVQAYFWKPEELILEHSHRDFGAGNLRYLEWKNSGHLRTSPGQSIDPIVIAQCLAELHAKYKIKGMAYDRWRVDELLREFDRIGLHAYKDKDESSGTVPRQSGLRICPWGQGFKDMAPAVDALEKAVAERRLIHNNNPCLNWNLANAVAVLDPSGNRKIDKMKSHFRVDGAVALAMMLGLRARDRGAKPLFDVESLIG